AQKALPDKKEVDETAGGRLSLFQDWVACKGNNTAILARHQQTLTEAKNSKVKYGFRGEKYLIDTHGEKKAQKIIARKKQLGLTIEDPEDSDDLLYFVLINIDINNINELKRTTSLEIAGQVDQEILKAFTEEGGVLDPKAMKVGDLTKSAAMQSALNFASMPSQNGKGKGKPKTKKEKNEVKAAQPLDKAKALMSQILKEANSCRDFAFKLRPLEMSEALIGQLQAVEVKLSGEAKALQALIKKKKNKSKHYAKTLAEVEKLKELAKERVDLAKALIRAAEKSPKEKTPKSSSAKGGGFDAVHSGSYSARRLLLKLCSGVYKNQKCWVYSVSSAVCKGPVLQSKLVFCVVRESTNAKPKTNDRIGEVIGWICKCLQSGKYPDKDFDGKEWPSGTCSIQYTKESRAVQLLGYLLTTSNVASTVKMMMFWLADFLYENRQTVGGPKRAMASYTLAMFQRMLDVNGPWLNEADAERTGRYGRTFLLSYQDLANQHRGGDKQNYKVTPKFHSFLHMCLTIERTKRNARYEHVYTDESLMGHLGRIASRTHALSMERATMHRYRALLELCWDVKDETRRREP
ncbi:unnamed protein product, partial [Symbiodinium pilosum]